MQTKVSTADTGANGQNADDRPTTLAPVGTAITREVRSFLADIEDLVKATTSLTGDDLARAKARLAERVAAAKGSIEKMAGTVAEGTRHAAKATDGFVHERPWQAIGIGAAVGVLVGFVVARR